MKKTTLKMNVYGWVFLLRAIMFNVSLGFSIDAAVHYADGLSWVAIAAISTAGLWFLFWDIVHYLWFAMTSKERGLYLAIRRHGHIMPTISNKEIKSRKGQSEFRGFFDDPDGALEIKMAVNGAVTIINVFVGFHWILNSKKFNKTPQEFKYQVSK